MENGKSYLTLVLQERFRAKDDFSLLVFTKMPIRWRTLSAKASAINKTKCREQGGHRSEHHGYGGDLRHILQWNNGNSHGGQMEQH